ncbi:MAG: acyltransferase [Clostridia bacterium]|nr:acyltransferase [Clostridia bacterium]NCD02761.1 acyltransferase [Clostridia bacterium]
MQETSYYSSEELKKIGFGEIGSNVLVSRKSSFYSPEKIKLGSNIRIDDFCILSGNITLGNYVHIGAYSGIFSGDAHVRMGNYTSLSSKCSIYAASDDYSGAGMTNPTVPSEYKKVYQADVEIRDHSIIGTGSTILPGVTIAEGCSFGACSLINRDTEEWSVNGGVPAKKLKDRKRDILQIVKKLEEESK